MERFCDELRQERERRGVSLETIGAITKVAQRHLIALEAGEYASLPSGVFRKGILRGYLAALELQPEPWVTRFDACVTALEQPPLTAETMAEFAENISRNRAVTRAEPARWPGVFVMLALLLVFGWCVWHFALRGRVVLTQRAPAGHALTTGAAATTS